MMVQAIFKKCCALAFTLSSAVLMLTTGVAGAESLVMVGSQPENTFRYLTVAVPYLDPPPVIDGEVDYREWRNAAMAPRLLETDTQRLTELTGRFYFGYTDQALYLAYQIERPEQAIEPRATILERDTPMYPRDDALEFLLNAIVDPEFERPLTNYRDYYFMWNALGTRFDRLEYPRRKIAWNPAWETASRVVPDFGWEGEVRIPFADLDYAVPPQPGHVWGYKLFDNRITPSPRPATSAWSHLWSSARDFANLRFIRQEAVHARVLDSGVLEQTGHAGLVLEVVNPAVREQEIAVDLRFFRRHEDLPSSLGYLEKFDLFRVRAADHEVAVDETSVQHPRMSATDSELAESILARNYELLMEQRETVSLPGTTRQLYDFTRQVVDGDFLVLYNLKDEESGTVIAGGVLPFRYGSVTAGANKIAVMTDLPESSPTYENLELLLGDGFIRIDQANPGQQLADCRGAVGDLSATATGKNGECRIGIRGWWPIGIYGDRQLRGHLRLSGRVA